MFHSYFFRFPNKVEVLILLFTFFSILLYSQPGQQIPQFCKFSFLLLLIIIKSGRMAEMRLSVCISKSQRNLRVSFSKTDSGLSIYYLFVWSNLNFLHNSQLIPLPTQSCLALDSFCINMQHSLIMRLIVSSLSPHNLHLLFCCVLSVLALIWLVLMALFCAAIRRDSISLFKYPFLSNIQVFTCKILLVSRLYTTE